MTTNKRLSYVSFVARVLVGGVLLYAGFMKAVGPSVEFTAALHAYHHFPTALIIPLALGLPWIEMWVGVFVLFGHFTRIFAALAWALFTIFLSVLAISHF